MEDRMPATHQVKEKQPYYKTKLIWYRIKHGMVFMSILNLLRRTGVIIFPYWIELEGIEMCSEPTIKENKNVYQIRPLSRSEIENCYQILNRNLKELEERFRSEYLAIGLFRKEELCAFTMARLNSFSFQGKEFRLNPDEAYLENMYTFEKHRGKNLAAYLRYHSYKVLADKGRTVCYSITDYTNKSSIKFKSKLNVQHLELWLHTGLFNRFRWNVRLKTYPVP